MVMMLLQRTPISWMVAELPLLLNPRVAQIIKWISGVAVTSVFYNTVTGATGDLSLQPGAGAVNGVVNKSMSAAIRAEDAFIVSVSVEGTLPPGMNSNIAPDGRVTNGVVAFSGTPSEIGSYPVSVTVTSWEEDSTYEGDPVFIDFEFSITAEGPEITQQPVSMVVPFGGTAELSVDVANGEGVTYRWQRNVGQSLEVFADIDGATASIYSVPNATPALEGAYRVIVTRNNQSETSNVVFLTVDETPTFATWQVREFEDPESEEAGPLENPDGDSFTNAFEFLFDLDPEMPETIQFPQVSQEKIDSADYVVFTFPPLIDFPDLMYAFETTEDLANGPWSELSHGFDGVIIETTGLDTVLKLPVNSPTYVRLKVDTGS